MNLLLVDYISTKGHQNFNRIHIESLLRLGHSILLVGKKGQFDNIEVTDSLKKTDIPDWMFKHLPLGQLTERLMGVLRLLWIRGHFRRTNNDAVVFLIYDVLSFFFYRTKQKVFIINHNNVSQLFSRVKLCLTKRLPLNYTHIALNEEMEQRLKDLLPGRSVFLVPHGVCPPSSVITKPPFVEAGERFIICPVNRNYDNSFVKGVFESEQLRSYLDNNNTRLYIKESMPIEASSAVCIIAERIDYGSYNYLLKNSAAVILPYSSEFQYRSSGILFECIAYNKPIIAYDIMAMRIYLDKVEMKLFSDTSSLIACIDYYLNNTVVKHNVKSFIPDSFWMTALKSLS